LILAAVVACDVAGVSHRPLACKQGLRYPADRWPAASSPTVRRRVEELSRPLVPGDVAWFALATSLREPK
jgi:hypothetical protein